MTAAERPGSRSLEERGSERNDSYERLQFVVHLGPRGKIPLREITAPMNTARRICLLARDLFFWKGLRIPLLSQQHL